MPSKREALPEVSGAAVAGDKHDCLQDRALVDYCLTGEPRAWTALYQHCHESLLRAVRQLLGKAAANADLVDEIAARVWYSLVRNNGSLLDRFDPERGCRLTTFLAILAKNEARQYFRSERRRRAREEAASQSTSGQHFDDIAMRLDADEAFVDTLTPAESQYYKTVLLGHQSEGRATQYSAGNSWQLSHRVRRKLRIFLGSGQE